MKALSQTIHKIKFFTDRRTGQTLFPPIFQYQDVKKIFSFLSQLISGVMIKHLRNINITERVDLSNRFRIFSILNERPMGHIAHLSNLGLHGNIICISFPPFNPRGPMILINLPLFYVRKLSCKMQLFWLHSS
jgi:hypothetical protein